MGCRHRPHSRSTSRRVARGTHGEHTVLSEESGCVAKEEGLSEDVTLEELEIVHDIDSTKDKISEGDSN